MTTTYNAQNNYIHSRLREIFTKHKFLNESNFVLCRRDYIELDLNHHYLFDEMAGIEWLLFFYQ